MTSDAEVSDADRSRPVDPDRLVEPSRSAKPQHSRAEPVVLAAIAIGGFAGGLTRYEIALAVPAAHGRFPIATFAINVSGSFLLALLLVFVLEIWPPTKYVRPLLGVGFCGAYTTFSTWMVDADRLIGAGNYATAAWYLLGSLGAGLAATSLGLTVGRAVVAHRRKVRGERSGP